MVVKTMAHETAVRFHIAGVRLTRRTVRTGEEISLLFVKVREDVYQTGVQYCTPYFAL